MLISLRDSSVCLICCLPVKDPQFENDLKNNFYPFKFARKKYFQKIIFNTIQFINFSTEREQKLLVPTAAKYLLYFLRGQILRRLLHTLSRIYAMLPHLPHIEDLPSIINRL